MILEILILVLTFLLLVFLQSKNKDSWKIFLITATGVLLFQYYTQAIWIVNGLESWAYIYLDVSWIMTLLWSNIIICSLFIVDKSKPKLSEIKKFFLSVGVIFIFVIIIERVFIELGIRSYSQAVLDLLEISTPLFGGFITLREIIYIFAFMSLVVGFIKYWQSNLELQSFSKGGKLR